MRYVHWLPGYREGGTRHGDLVAALGGLGLSGIANVLAAIKLARYRGLGPDDAIVITEAIETFREGRSDPIDVIRHAVRRVGAASISGTVTTVLVFAPMLAISGILGEFIRILPISVIVAAHNEEKTIVDTVRSLRMLQVQAWF